jgi:hypothetical protein
MAQKRTIDIDINTNADQAAKQFDTLATGVKKAADSAENLDAKFEDVFQGVQPLTTRLGEAEDRLYELALAGDTTSKEYQELLNKVSEYRKVQISTDLAVDQAAQTFTQKLGTALGGATSGFAAVQGTMALVGSESESLEKTLVKVQAALAIQQGVAGVLEYSRSIGLATKATKVWGMVTGTTTGLMKALRVALASTGIGLLVVGIGALIANFEKVTKFFSPVIDGLKSIGDAIGLTNFASEERKEKLKAQMELEMQMAEEELKAHNARMDQMRSEQAEQDKLLSKEIELAKARGEDATKLQEEQLKKRLENLKENFAKEEKAYQDEFGDSVKRSKETIAEQTAALQFLVDSGKRGFQDLSREEKEAFKQVGGDYIDSVESLKSNIQSETEFLEGYLTESRTKFGKTTEAQIKEAEANIKIFNANTTASEKAEQKKKLDNYKQYLRDRLNAERRIEDLKLKLMGDGLEKELELNRINFERQIQDITAKGKQKQEIIDLLNDLQLKKEKEIQEKFRQQRLDDFTSSIEPLKLAEDAKTEIVIQGLDKRTEAEKKYQKDIQDMQIRNKEFAIQATLDTLNLISDITELFGKKGEKQAKRAFQVQKAAQIAGATIETFRSAQSAYLSQFVPAPDPSSPVRGSIAAGIAVAAGLTNVAKIASQKFEGGGASGGSSFSGGDVSGAAAQAPSFNVVGDSAINQIASIQQQPVQAFVVSGEVTTSQALDRNRVENATL